MTTLVFDGVATSARTVDENGYMHVSDCPVTKEQVAPYYGYEIPQGERFGIKPNKVYYVYRPAEELSKAATMASLRGIPLLADHASVTPEDIRRDRIVGSTGDLVRWDGTYLRCNLNILAKGAQDRVKDKSMRELSLGYSYTPEFKSGEFNGTRYDFVMRDIKANHLALVEVGRAGSDVRVCDSMPNGLTETTTVDTEKLAALVAQLTELIQPAQTAVPVEPVGDEDEVKEVQLVEVEGQDPEQPEGAVTKDTDPTEDEDTVTDEDEVKDEDSVTDSDEVSDEDTVEDEDETQDDDELCAKICAALGLECTPETAAKLNGVLNNGMATDSGKRIKRGLAMDSATFNRKLKEATAAGQKAALEKMRSLTTAAEKCSPILGRVKALNYDSAGAIYRDAAIKAGMSAKDARDAKAARGYVLAVLKQPKSRPIAMDHAPSDATAASLIKMLDKKGV